MINQEALQIVILLSEGFYIASMSNTIESGVRPLKRQYKGYEKGVVSSFVKYERRIKRMF